MCKRPIIHFISNLVAIREAIRQRKALSRTSSNILLNSVQIGQAQNASNMNYLHPSDCDLQFGKEETHSAISNIEDVLPPSSEDEKDECDELRVPSPPPRRLSRSSIDLRDLEQERYEKVTHTDSAPSMIALHYAAQQNQEQQRQQPDDSAEQLWCEAPTFPQKPPNTSTSPSISNNDSPSKRCGSDGMQIKSCEYQIFGLNSDDSETNDYYEHDCYVKMKQQAPISFLPIAEDNKELKRLIEDNYLYFKKQMNSNQSELKSAQQFPALSETDFIKMKKPAPSQKKSLAHSDSEFQKKDIVMAKQTAKTSAKSDKGFNIRSLLAKTKRSGTECFSLEKKRHQANSEEIRSNRAQIFRRSRIRKLSQSCNGAVKDSKSGPRARQHSDTDSDATTTTTRYNTPDILLDINAQPGTAERSPDSWQSDELDVQTLTRNATGSTQLIDLESNVIPEVSASDDFFSFAESPLLPATPPPSLSPPSLVDAMLPEQAEKKHNVVITSSTDLLELFRSLSFPVSERAQNPHEHLLQRQPQASTQSTDSKEISSKKRIRQRLSTLSDQVLMTRNSTSFFMSPPATPNFNSTQHLPTMKHNSNINVYFLSPPPTVNVPQFSMGSPSNQFASNNSTISLDMLTTLPIPQHQQPTLNVHTMHTQSISPKPEIILDSTISPTATGTNGSLVGEEKDLARNRNNLLTAYEGIQTVRKRQPSVVTYDVNVINFSNDNSDNRSYIPLARVSTSSASEYGTI